MPLRCAYLPVSRLARAGQHTGVLAKVCLNSMPSAASRSILGVLTSALPIQPSDCARNWSGMMNSMFGCWRGCAANDCATAAPSHRHSAKPVNRFRFVIVPFNFRWSSKRDTKRQLYAARISGASDRAEGRCAERAARQTEIRVVEHVEKLAALFGLPAFVDFEILEQRKVHDAVAGTA